MTRYITKCVEGKDGLTTGERIVWPFSRDKEENRELGKLLFGDYWEELFDKWIDRPKRLTSLKIVGVTNDSFDVDFEMEPEGKEESGGIE